MKTKWTLEISTVEAGLSEYDLFAEDWPRALTEATRIAAFISRDGYEVRKISVLPAEDE